MVQDQSRDAAGSGVDPTAVPQPKSARYALIEADDIRASHNADLRPTDGYPAELTRPDWTRADADQRVQGIVRDFDPARLAESVDDGTGAPIVLRDGTVEAGNARVIAMQRVYQANGAKADTYRQHLRENAGRFGLQPEQVDSMKAPVLVRMPDQPDSATLAARGEPDTLNSWAPGANYVPLVDDARAPASKAKTVADLPSPTGLPCARPKPT